MDGFILNHCRSWKCGQRQRERQRKWNRNRNENVNGKCARDRRRVQHNKEHTPHKARDDATTQSKLALLRVRIIRQRFALRLRAIMWALSRCGTILSTAGQWAMGNEVGMSSRRVKKSQRWWWWCWWWHQCKIKSQLPQKGCKGKRQQRDREFAYRPRSEVLPNKLW